MLSQESTNFCLYFRLPRLIKVITFWEFTARLDSILAKPYYLRIVKTVVYMLYLIHLNACAYYAISYWEGIGVNDFVYDGQGNSYIRCFYFATKVNKASFTIILWFFYSNRWRDCPVQPQQFVLNFPRISPACFAGKFKTL